MPNKSVSICLHSNRWFSLTTEHKPIATFNWVNICCFCQKKSSLYTYVCIHESILEVIKMFIALESATIRGRTSLNISMRLALWENANIFHFNSKAICLTCAHECKDLILGTYGSFIVCFAVCIAWLATVFHSVSICLDHSKCSYLATEHKPIAASNCVNICYICQRTVLCIGKFV